MRFPFLLFFVPLSGLALASCSSAPTPELVVTAPSTLSKPAISGVLAGSFGQGLGDEDRQLAFEAQLTALDKGQRQTWRGKKGAFGFIETGAEAPRAEGVCREYTHKIYLAGRPQTGKGTACRDVSGTWRFLS